MSSEAPKPKMRKQYVYSKQREVWSEEEHQRFLEALALYKNDWKKMQPYVRTRTLKQLRSHAQKYFIRLKKLEKDREETTPEKIQAQLRPPSTPPPLPQTQLQALFGTQWQPQIQLPPASQNNSSASQEWSAVSPPTANRFGSQYEFAAAPLMDEKPRPVPDFGFSTYVPTIMNVSSFNASRVSTDDVDEYDDDNDGTLSVPRTLVGSPFNNAGPVTRTPTSNMIAASSLFCMSTDNVPVMEQRSNGIFAGFSETFDVNKQNVGTPQERLRSVTGRQDLIDGFVAYEILSRARLECSGFNQGEEQASLFAKLDEFFGTAEYHYQALLESLKPIQLCCLQSLLENTENRL